MLLAIAHMSRMGRVPARMSPVQEATGLDPAAIGAAAKALRDAGLIERIGAQPDDSIVLPGYLAANQRRQPKARADAPVTLADWLVKLKAIGEPPIPEGDAIESYAADVGITDEMLDVQWFVFRTTYTDDRKTKRYADWRAVYRGSVRGNWFKLWFVDGANGPKWTTVGAQAIASHAAHERRRESLKQTTLDSQQ